MTTSRLPVIIIALVVAAATVATAAWLGPRHQHLGSTTAGDQQLAERVRAAIDDDSGLRTIAVAEVTPDAITWAGLGELDAGQAPTADTVYETGSIAKTFVAQVFSDAVTRGEVAPDDTLGSHVPELADSPAGGVTLQSLAQHTSGLPRLTAQTQLNGLSALFTNGNPYAGIDTTTLIDQAASAPITTAGESVYSNLGIALLAEALVRATGAEDWPTLADERLFTPVGMSSTAVVDGPEQLPAEARTGRLANGWQASRWYGSGYAPSGTSVYSTLADMARFAQANLTGEAPGAEESMDLTLPTGDGQAIGRVWTSLTADGAVITWHNGATAGASTMLAMDRESGRAIVMLSDSARTVDGIALEVLTGMPLPDSAPSPLLSWVMWGIGLLLSVGALAGAVVGKHRAGIIAGVLSAVFGAVLALAWGPWSHVGGWAFGVLLAPATAAVVIGAVRWRDLPWARARHGWLSWVGVGVAAVLAGASFVVL